MKLKIIIFILLLFSIKLTGQEAKISYFNKNQEKVNENQDWDYKIIQNSFKKNNSDFIEIQAFNKMNVLIKIQNFEENIQNKYFKIYEEIIYPDHNCKTISETVSQNDIKKTTEKCLSLNGKVLFSEKKCIEDSKNISQDRDFLNWLNEHVKDIFNEEEAKLKYVVVFVVKPNYEIMVSRINNKSINNENLVLNILEKKVIKLIEKIPQKYFEGKLKKIAGEIAETEYNLPIYWMGINE